MDPGNHFGVHAGLLGVTVSPKSSRNYVLGYWDSLFAQFHRIFQGCRNDWFVIFLFEGWEEVPLAFRRFWVYSLGVHVWATCNIHN